MRPLTALPTLTALVAALVLAASAPGVSLPEGAGTGTAGTTPGAGPGALFVVTGSGNGHGVGLSQYGALAQAQAGRTAADILSFYFPGAELVRKPAVKLRVLLAPAAKSLSISSTAPFTARDGAGHVHELSAGVTTLDPQLVIPVDGVPTPLAGPVTFVPATGARLAVGSRSYRGSIEVSANGTALQAVDIVGLEGYLQGVVASEVPSSWPASALEAQAIAARSYALATRVKAKAWDLYPDGRSQQYLGVAAETPETTAAVRATSGSVLFYGGVVATAFYSSSSGGRTQSGLDAFGLDVPYLPARVDPWDDASPFHVWQPRVLTGKQVAKALGLSAPVVDVQAASRRPAGWSP